MTYTEEKVENLKNAFEIVEDSSDWKNPIDTWIPKESDFDLISEAVGFYTGSELHVGETNDQGLTHVWADGYYIAIG